MTGPERNSESCLPKTLNVSQGEAKGNIEGKKILCLTPAGTHIYHSFKEHDLIMCKSKIQVFL